MELAAARAIVDEAAAFDTFGPLRDRGHAWLHGTLVPAIERVEAAALAASDPPAVDEALSHLCYLVADVHETRDAPRAAISWYERSLRAWPEHAAAWRELGTCHLEMGEPAPARLAALTALSLDPADHHARRDLEDLRDPGVGPRYLAGDPRWAAREALARARAGEALAALADLDDSPAVLLRAEARGVAGDHDGLLAELDRLRGRPEAPELGELWFFLPEPLWRDPRLWLRLDALPLGPHANVPRDHPWLPRPMPHAPVDDAAAFVRLQLAAVAGA